MVYAARWGHRQVALKVLHPTQVANERERERFFAEARLLADITHPSVVKVLGVDALPDGRPYLAMEMIEGETLATRLRRGPLPLADALGLFEQLVGAVDALHKRGLVHRDLKPENIMLVNGATGQFVVLLDFGIAKELDAPASTVTQEGAVRGTPAYMAPERFFGQPASPATDIYELAVVLYAMLVGRLPWGEAGDASARLNPTPPSKNGAQLPAKLETALLAALSTRPEARPPSAGAFFGAVRTATSGSTGRVRQTADIPAPTPAPEDSEVSPFAPTKAVAQQALHANAPTTPATPAALRKSRRIAAYAAAGALVLGIATVLVIVLWPGETRTGETAAAVPPDAGTALDATAAVAERPSGDANAIRSALPKTSRSVDVSGLARAIKHHPADTKFLVGLNAHQLLHKSAFGPLLNKAKSKKISIIDAFVKACKIDFYQAIDWVTIGVVDIHKDVYDVMLSGEWERAQLEKCLGKSIDKREGKLSRMGDLWLGWLDERTIFYSTRKNATRKWVEARLAGKGGVDRSKRLGSMVEKVDLRGTVWFVGGPDEVLEDRVVKSIPEPSFIFGSIAIAKDIKGGLWLRYRSKAKAAKAGKTLRVELDKLRGDAAGNMLLGKVRIDTKGKDVRLTGYLDPMITSFLATYVVDAIQQKLAEK